MHFKLIPSVILLNSLLAGCIGTVQYPTPNIQVSSSQPLTVGVQDQRDYVLSEDKPDTFIGIFRSFMGIPNDINTQSRAPLATDFANVLVSALERPGLSVTPVTLKPEWNQEKIRTTFVQAKSRKAVLLTIREWKSEMYQLGDLGLPYDLTLEVLDANGVSLAKETIQGKDNLGGNSMNIMSHILTSSNNAFKEKVETLFGNPSIVKAIQS